MKRYIQFLLLVLFALTVFPVQTLAAEQKDAKELFNNIYNKVFGDEGSSFSYDVNIIGLYKTKGSIIYKGTKIQYTESRYLAWEDGVTAYMVDKKKKEVRIYNHTDEEKDNMLSKFKYDVNNFDFSYREEGSYYLVMAKVRNAKFFGIRYVEAKVDKKTLYPVSLTIKLAILKTTVYISDFKAGNISDSAFIFPKERFKGYNFVDKRKAL